VIQAVLDASALLALLLGEPGANKVRAILAKSAVASVNLSEIVGYFARNGAAESDIRLVLDPLPIARIPF
jgi:PIN domain nuclease of toxin-antitoxin system